MTRLDQTDKYRAYCQGALPDLYPLLHRLRSEDPVHWSGTLNSWLLTRYADVLPALSDHRLSAERMPVFMQQLSEPMREEFASLLQHFSLFFANMDPPAHTRMRRLVSASFTPKMVNALALRIQVIVDGLIDAVAPAGEMDAIRDFAYPLPATVIAEMLGIPPADRLNFGQWSRDLTDFLGATRTTLADVAAQADRSLRRLTEYFQGLIARRRQDDDRHEYETGGKMPDARCEMHFVSTLLHTAVKVRRAILARQDRLTPASKRLSVTRPMPPLPDRCGRGRGGNLTPPHTAVKLRRAILARQDRLTPASKRLSV